MLKLPPLAVLPVVPAIARPKGTLAISKKPLKRSPLLAVVPAVLAISLQRRSPLHVVAPVVLARNSDIGQLDNLQFDNWLHVEFVKL